MTIDRIGSIDPIQPEKRPGRAEQAKGTPKTDSVNISSLAQEKAELLRVREIAASAPDVRADRVAELKAKIDDPSYINNAVLNATADRLIDALFG